MLDFDTFINLPSPIHPIEDEWLDSKGIRLYIKRDDLIHPSVSGNKFRKLKYNLLKMKALDTPQLLTIGGAFSNHIYATAAIGKLLNIKTIGVIRGDITSNTNNTLFFAQNCGMTLHFIDRTTFRDKNNLFNILKEQFGDFYYIPEGGHNSEGAVGCGEIVGEVENELGFAPDYFCTACGTGTTYAGLSNAIKVEQHVLGFVVLKNENLQSEIEDLRVETHQSEENLRKNHSTLIHDYHFGGYAKWTPELIHFLNNFKIKYKIQLDPIYTAKMFYGLFDLIEKDYFKKGTSIVALHTGGLQGIEGFNALKLKNAPVKIDISQ